MRRKWLEGYTLAAVLLLTAGCWTTESDLRPPKHPEEFVLPPLTESRFSAPVAYPKEAQRDLSPKKSFTDPMNGLGNAPRLGSGPGMMR